MLRVMPLSLRWQPQGARHGAEAGASCGSRRSRAVEENMARRMWRAAHPTRRAAGGSPRRWREAKPEEQQQKPHGLVHPLLAEVAHAVRMQPALVCAALQGGGELQPFLLATMNRSRKANAVYWCIPMAEAPRMHAAGPA